MAKIINAGVCLPVCPEWPIGTLAECAGCSCRWIVEDGDKCKAGTHVLGKDGSERINVQCPHCGDFHTHRSSAARGSSARPL